MLFDRFGLVWFDCPLVGRISIDVVGWLDAVLLGLGLRLVLRIGDLMAESLSPWMCGVNWLSVNCFIIACICLFTLKHRF